MACHCIIKHIIWEGVDSICGPSGDRPGTICGPSGDNLRTVLVTIWGPSGDHLGIPSVDHLGIPSADRPGDRRGTIWGPSADRPGDHLGTIWGPSGNSMGPSGDHLGTHPISAGTPWGPSGDHLGTIWGFHGTLWGRIHPVSISARSQPEHPDAAQKTRFIIQVQGKQKGQVLVYPWGDDTTKPAQDPILRSF